MRIKSYLILSAITLGITVSSCKKAMDLDINVNPNSPVSAPLDLLLTSAEFTTPGIFNGISNTTLGFVGILANQGSDAFAITNSSYNGTWNSFYTGGMKDLQTILDRTAAGQSPHFRGAAFTLKAYYFGQFVDLFGDVPYDEAFAADAATPINEPKFSKDKDIYAKLIAMTDSAIAEFAKTSPIALKGDIHFANNIPRWRKFANSVKLSLLIKTRRVDPSADAKIKAILASSANYISATSGAEDFLFKYNKVAAPEGRHPWFTDAYLGSNNFTYFSKQFMLEMLELGDPRLPYEVRRQTATLLDPNNSTDRGTIPVYGGYMVLDNSTWSKLTASGTLTNTTADSAYLAGFFGRVRGDQTGVPADVAVRAVPGAYPGGGLVDFARTTARADVKPLLGGSGAGNGVFPMITFNMIQYWDLEQQLASGSATAATKTLFEAAMRQSIADVVRHSKSSDPSAVDPSATAVTTYVDKWLARYDAAVSDGAKLNVVLKQAWFSGIGNGNELYSTFRRTGYPSTIDEPASRQRQFALRLPYPSTELNLNPNATSYGAVIFDRDPIFWDAVKFKF
jgi:hypothetical protein